MDDPASAPVVYITSPIILPDLPELAIYQCKTAKLLANAVYKGGCACPSVSVKVHARVILYVL